MTVDIDNALTEEIAAKVRAAGTSFYSAMRLLAPDRRNAMYAIYAFCREGDHIDLPPQGGAYLRH